MSRRLLFAGLSCVAALTLRAERAAAQTVFIVRHAERASSERDSDLSPAGFARAAALDTALMSAGVSRVLVTEFQRTRKTGLPVAQRVGVTPTVVATGRDVAAHAAAVAAAATAAGPDGVVLVVGHSNTVNRIVAALGGEVAPDLCDAQYSTITVVRKDDGLPVRVARLTFGTPDSADAASCQRPSMRE